MAQPPASPSSAYSSDPEPSDAGASDSSSEYSCSAYTPSEAPTEAGGPGLFETAGQWLLGKAGDAHIWLAEALARRADELGPPVIYTPRDALAPRVRPTRAGKIATIPW